MLTGFLKRLSPRYQIFTGAHELAKGNAIAQAAEYRRLHDAARAANPDDPAAAGYKVYSQTDEDGVIADIFHRIGAGSTFLEIGVQTGIECNSLLLLLKGWRGAWVEGSDGYCRTIRDTLGGDAFSNRFTLINSFVTRGNIRALYDQSRAFLEVEEIDFFSLDIDGNDLHVMETLLDAGARPGIVCVEYHGKFPPPVRVTIRYADDHVWDETDYMGTSLQSFVDLFERFGYRLVTCNVSGINAFFAREDLASGFAKVEPRDVYRPYRAYLSPIRPPQPPTLRYLRDLLHAQA